MVTELKTCRKGLHQYSVGLRTCPECKKISNKKWQEHNKEKLLNYSRKWQRNNREIQRQRCKNHYKNNKKLYQEKRRIWIQKNPGKEKGYVQKWRLKNKHLLNANAAKRRSAKNRAIPLWADLEKIKQIYKEAELLTKQTNVFHHVDHIYPLQSKYLCGLHVETNLQILTAKQNISKGNKEWPGQLDCQKD